tara:strand:- start:94834 stop:95583 length:750 start_codon:yes stop_codon:yes gene_type:complete
MPAIKNFSLQHVCSTALVLGLGLGMQSTAMAFEFNPTLGADAAYSSLRFKNGFGNPVYKQHNSVINLYVANPLWEFIGVEAGYQWFPERDNNVRLNPGQRALSGGPATVAGDDFSQVESKRKLDAPYLGLTFNYQVPDCRRINFFALLGGAYVDLTAEEKTVADVDGALAANIISASTRKFNDSKIVFVAKLGASLMVTENIGLRAFGSWMNTNRFKVNSDPVVGFPAEVRMKDTYMLGIGVFATNFLG